MRDPNAVSTNTGTGQVTLGHLLLAIAFCQPVGVAVIQIKHSGGGILGCLVVVPVALALGFSLPRSIGSLEGPCGYDASRIPIEQNIQ